MKMREKDMIYTVIVTSVVLHIIHPGGEITTRDGGLSTVPFNKLRAFASGTMRI